MAQMRIISEKEHKNEKGTFTIETVFAGDDVGLEFLRSWMIVPNDPEEDITFKHFSGSNRFITINGIQWKIRGLLEAVVSKLGGKISLHQMKLDAEEIEILLESNFLTATDKFV